MQPDNKYKADSNSSGTILQGIVEAGFSTPTDGFSDGENISLDQWIISDKDKSFMLKVRSDSMADAGIQIGDYLVVERTSMANTGSIVLVVIDGKWTMGYLRNDSNGHFIERANRIGERDFPIIDSTSHLKHITVFTINKAIKRKAITMYRIVA